MDSTPKANLELTRIRRLKVRVRSSGRTLLEGISLAGSCDAETGFASKRMACRAEYLP